MKPNPLLASLVLAFTATAAIGAPEDRTAKSVKAHAEALAGGSVSVEVTHVTPIKKLSTDDVSVMAAHTYDVGEDLPAGTILVAVSKERHDAFVKKYGATPEVDGHRAIRNLDTKRLTGTLRHHKDGPTLIDVTDGGLSPGFIKMLADSGAHKMEHDPKKAELARKKFAAKKGGPAAPRAKAKR